MIKNTSGNKNKHDFYVINFYGDHLCGIKMYGDHLCGIKKVVDIEKQHSVTSPSIICNNI